ncbi:hypothetical protein IHE49_00275 [Rhodanobacter sp. 7MK24]|uniref:hypothetical protein n=1 Tax=Rhodanobacter sp. 7MK24 TaxID=2775922 RepID=UPI0017860547|nr:hypothetical protein [Rhodanobacter sp. 7MK24]MBD8878909.1 hypothetical protein [Rhodanobacter sp. 7MK24]
MIELEIQALALQREGLLIEVGRLAGTCGYTLVRQRSVQDPHGTLLSMIVRGSWFKKRALRAALATCDRLVSFELHGVVEGEQREHFAATNKTVSNYVPPPAPEPETVEKPVEEVAAVAEAEPAPAAVKPTVQAPEPAPPESFDEFIVVHQRAPAPAPAEPPPAPFIEVEVLEADVMAVDKALASLEYDYPRIMPNLLALDRKVAAGARESSLQLAGQRVGAWLHAREHAQRGKQTLPAALAAIGAPALQGIVEVDLQDGQLHIRHSPLCAEGGHSGCSFYSGFLEGLLAHAIAPQGLSIFPVCCRSFGADDCVLAVSES